MVTRITKIGDDAVQDWTVRERVHATFFVAENLAGDALLALSALRQNPAQILG